MEKLVIIAGTNASGKSGLGIELVLAGGAEIISADSRQVFKGLFFGFEKLLNFFAGIILLKFSFLLIIIFFEELLFLLLS